MILSSDELAHLIERVAKHDRRAFQTLYTATREKLRKTALLIVHDREDAEDLVQEAYLKVWSHAASYRRGAFSPISWLAAIIRNQAVDFLRRRRAPQFDLSAAETVVDTGLNPEQIAIRENMTRVMHHHLDALPHLKRGALTAAFIEGITFTELAIRQEIHVNTAKTRVYRALEELRRLC